MSLWHSIVSQATVENILIVSIIAVITLMGAFISKGSYGDDEIDNYLGNNSSNPDCDTDGDCGD